MKANREKLKGNEPFSICIYVLFWKCTFQQNILIISAESTTNLINGLVRTQPFLKGLANPWEWKEGTVCTFTFSKTFFHDIKFWANNQYNTDQIFVKSALWSGPYEEPFWVVLVRKTWNFAPYYPACKHPPLIGTCAYIQVISTCAFIPLTFINQ